MCVQRDSRKKEKENIYERKDMKFLTFIPFLTILLPALYSDRAMDKSSDSSSS